jgi:hypothetical protein
LLYTFTKNLEANHFNKEILFNKFEEIIKMFEDKKEVTKEEFIQSFVNLFIEAMKVSQNDDKKLINELLNGFLEISEDTSLFIKVLETIFENVVDYTRIDNKEEILNAIASELYPYKEKLKKRFEQNDNKIISFENLKAIISDLNISLSDEYKEFLIYKMKEKVPENRSIFDLDYGIILGLLDKNIINNINDINCTNKDEDKKE